MESREMISKINKANEKIEALETEYNERLQFENNYYYSSQTGKKGVLAWGWLIPAALVEVARFAQIGDPDMTADVHIPLLAVSLGCLIAMIIHTIKRAKKRSEARSYLAYYEDKYRNGRKSEDILYEIKSMQKEQKKICGYSGKEWNLDLDDGPQVEADLMAIMRWIRYVKPSRKEIFDCWPFNECQDYFQEYERAMEYLRNNVDGKPPSVKAEREQAVVRQIKRLSDTKHHISNSSGNWYIVTFSMLCNVILFSLNCEHAKYVAKIYRVDYNENFANTIDYDGFRKIIREMLSYADTEEKKEFINLICQAANVMKIDISEFGFKPFY